MKEKEKDIVDKSQIVYKTLNEVLHESMIPYTEHVVMDRALPRVEDGLKPVQRRILYSMLELGLTPDKQYRKSARIVGDCMGKYHPHGDSSVYDAMVRMAQDYSLREPLVDGHGNFGSIDGDSAAAMRYTEAKMTPLALEILRDLDKNTVDWCLNFDDTLKEPIVLPGRFPNLLVNGATGIAVGVATNIPPHNLGEVIDGVCAYIKNPKISLGQMMKHIKAPDFPTGGIITAGDGLIEAYQTGKGKITIKAKIHTEKDGEKSAIVITELPYQTNKATLLQKIAELKEKEKGGVLSYIGEITDESDRNGMRAVIKVKKGGNSKAILNYILKNTNLEQSFNINMVAIAGGKPKLMGLIEIISYYVNYQISIIVRRTKFDLDNALSREHIVKGLLIAIKNIDEIIRIIKGSQSVSEAKQKIMQRFALTDIQAQAILDMRIARLVNLEVKKLEEEFAELQIRIKNLRAILASKQTQEDLIISELKDIKKRYENKRKSEIVLEKPQEQEEIFDLVDCDFSELNFITLSADHRMKRMVIKNTVSSNGTEPNNLYEINEDCIKANDNENIFVITNKGNCIKTRVKDFPLLQWKNKGALLSELNKTILFDEFAIRILPILKEEDAVVALYTKKGMAKRIPISELKINRAIFSIMNLKENDEIINAEYENENSNIIAITKMSYSLKFAKSELPMQKRASVGVKILKMQDDDEVVFAGLVQKIGSMIIIANSGYGKKVPIGDYEIMSKYRRGLKTISLKNDNSESVIFAKFSLKSFDLALENKGKFKIFNTDKLRYETRISKGNKIDKTNFNNIYLMLDKGKLD